MAESLATRDPATRDPATRDPATRDPATSNEHVLGEEDRSYRLAVDRALRLLGQREHSRQELTAKLISKGLDAATAGLVVDDLRGRGLQSDVRFTEAFVYSRVGRGHGPLRIRQELAQRGIDGDVAEVALSDDRAFWQEQAAAARCRKFGERPPENRDEWNRQARFLAQRGYPTDLIYRLLGTVDA